MDDNVVGNRYAIAENRRYTSAKDMYGGVVLDVDLTPYANETHITANYRIEPNTRFRANMNIANNMSALLDVSAGINLGADSMVGDNHDYAPFSAMHIRRGDKAVKVSPQIRLATCSAYGKRLMSVAGGQIMRVLIHIGLLLGGISFLTATPAAFSQSQETSTRPEGWQGPWPGDGQDAKPALQKEGIAPGPQGSSPTGKQTLEIPPHPQSTPESPRQQAAIPPRSQSETPRSKQLITVTVTDPQGRYVSGLQPEDFEVYEDAERQKITYFNTGQNEPVSLGFIVDVSTSMIPKLDHALFALQELLATVPPRSETFIEAFAGEPVTLQDFTDSRPVLRATLPYLRQELRRQGSLCSMEMVDRGMARHCGTSLYDALLSGLQHIKKGGLQKKALIVISDGLDNHSMGTLEEVVHKARESGVLIYAIGIGRVAQQSSFFGLAEESVDIPVLKQASELTGGRLFTMTAEDVLGNANTLAAATQIIARELSSQYSLGYTPARPGSHHREVQVVVRGKEAENLTVRSQKGYTPDPREREERRQAQRLHRW